MFKLQPVLEGVANVGTLAIGAVEGDGDSVVKGKEGAGIPVGCMVVQR